MYPAGNTGMKGRFIPRFFFNTRDRYFLYRLDRVLIIVSSEGSLAGQFVPNNWIIRSITALQGNLCIVRNRISSITTPFVIKSFLTCFTGCMLNSLSYVSLRCSVNVPGYFDICTQKDSSNDNTTDHYYTKQIYYRLLPLGE